MSHLGEYVGKIRRQQGLTPQQVARKLGYRNLNKGSRRILGLEREGICSRPFFQKLSRVLPLDSDEVRQCTDRDKRECEKWFNEPITPYLAVRWIPGFPISEDLPEHVKTDDQAETYACSRAKTVRKKVCLVLADSSSVWIGENGEIEHRAEPKPSEPSGPYVQIGNKRCQVHSGR